MPDTRNPHLGAPFTDDDAAIAAALEDVSVPVLLCSLVHMTGDPSWIRDVSLPHMPGTMDLQGGLDDDVLADVRRRAVPAIAAYRDGGCVPHELPEEVVVEMFAFLAGTPLDEDVMEPMFVEDMQFDGADGGAISWGDEVSDEAKAASPVVVIGCGLSGILAGIRLTQAGLPFVIVEKDEGPGGTWWENRYPGARVDVGSHHYCYAFEPSHHWTEYYCQQPELRDYFVRVLDTYGLRPRCRFGTEVTSLTWDEPTSSWQVGIRNPDGTTEVLEARFVISGVGSLNIPRMPDIPGMDDFTGPSFHSARWPDGLDLTGKRFALVGAGASGFQIAPTIADTVEQLTIYQRTTQWMLPNPLYHAQVPPGDRWAMQHLPFYARWFRFVMLYPGIAMGTEGYRIDPEFRGEAGVSINEENELRRKQLTAWITMHLEDRPDLIEQSIPDYPAMGKRILQDNGSWLRNLKKPNVELVHTAIERIVPDGVRTVDGTIRDADIICYATGFRHNDFLDTIELTGRNGVSLRDQWGDEPTAYLGITIPNFPNLFCMYGPGTNLAHGASLFFHSECQIHYAMDCVHRVLAAGARTIDVRKDAHDEYVERYRAEIDQLVWSHQSIEHSHYKNPQGKIFTLSPWPLERYWEWTRSADPDQYVLS
jgi:4-hydroxyacetophenone monooxygenase